MQGERPVVISRVEDLIVRGGQADGKRLLLRFSAPLRLAISQARVVVANDLIICLISWVGKRVLLPEPLWEHVIAL